MSFEPQKFFIGLIDFFSILLPGALLTWLLMDEAGPVVLGARYSELDDWQGGAAFLFASYLLGHLIFLLGSWLDNTYDWFRGRTLNRQIRQVATRGCLPNWLVRLIVSLVFKRERNLAVDRVAGIKAQALAKANAGGAINAFQWCKALLTVESPESLAAVQRFEADSKFFRCFSVVLIILLLAWPWHRQWPLSGIPVLLLLLLLALWRYMEQRHKATNQAYWSVIALTARDGQVALEGKAFAAVVPGRAGGVVYRLRGGVAECLLVEAKDDPAQRVLPKGRVEAGETHRETAVREVYEETGVWARIDGELGNVTWTVDGSAITTRFFLMRAIGLGLRPEKGRRHEWLPVPEALAKASHNETRELLLAAQRLIAGASQPSTTEAT